MIKLRSVFVGVHCNGQHWMVRFNPRDPAQVSAAIRTTASWAARADVPEVDLDDAMRLRASILDAQRMFATKGGA